MSSDLWTSEALKGIREKELDKHLKKNKAHYFAFAKNVMEQLRVAVGAPGQLQRGDLYSVLRDLIAMDAKLINALKAGRISDARRAKWFNWFTLYLVEEYWEEHGND